MRSALTATALALLSLTVIAVAQNQPLKFEVASVKAARSSDSSYNYGCHVPGDVIPKRDVRCDKCSLAQHHC